MMTESRTAEILIITMQTLDDSCGPTIASVLSSTYDLNVDRHRPHK